MHQYDSYIEFKIKVLYVMNLLIEPATYLPTTAQWPIVSAHIFLSIFIQHLFSLFSPSSHNPTFVKTLGTSLSISADTILQQIGTMILK